MSWIPTFLNPWTALIAASVAVPALLVLYFLKLRRRELAVSSTLLWKKAIQDLQVNAPFQRLRRNLLLLLQLLLLLALLLALSRPVTYFTPGAGKNTVILIDRSASMQARDADGRSRLEEAKRRATELVDTMTRGNSGVVIAFDDKAEIVQTVTTDTLKLKQAIESIQPTDRRSRLKLAYQLAEAPTNFDPQQLRATSQPDVWLFSDGRVLDASELSVRGNLKYEQIGTDQAKNVAIVALSAKRNYERPTEVQVFARLANYGTEPVAADVELRVAPIDPAEPNALDFKVRGLAAVSLLPERWNDEQRKQAETEQQLQHRESVEFTLELTTAAVVRLEHKGVEADQLAADDAAHVVIPPPKPLSVLLVTDGNYFMERLLSALDLKDSTVMSPVEYEQRLPGNFDVIVFDRAYTPQKLPPVGNFIYFGSVAPGLKLRQSTIDGKTVMLDQMGVLDWNRDHPILKGLSFAKVYAAEAMKMDVPPEAEVLVEGLKGPLMILHREGRSTHLVVTFDTLQSAYWVTSSTFPVFMYQALQFMALAGDAGVSQSYEPGDTPRIPRTNLQQLGTEPKQLRLSGPGLSRTVRVSESGDVALPALDRVGVYRLEPTVPQFERLAVNLLDASESDLVPSAVPPGNIGEAIPVAGRKSRLDLWWWLVACLALPLLLVEWWVYTRRVHL